MAMKGFSAREAGGGIPEQVRFWQAAADATPIDGTDPVVLLSTGFIRKAVAGDAALLGHAANGTRNNIAAGGAALGPQFPVAPLITDPAGNREVRVYVAREDVIFTAEVNGTTAATLRGEAHDLIVDGSGNGSINEAASATGVFHIIGLYPGEEAMAKGRVDYTITPAAKTNWQTPV